MVMMSWKQEQLSGPRQVGFTLVELLVAMSIFSLMLLIVVSGFINIVHLRSQALASNQAQDNARTAINEVVRAVRDSAGVVPGSIVTGSSGRICLDKLGGQVQQYFVNAGVLTRSDDCALVAPHVNEQAITNSVVQVVDFTIMQENSGPTIVKPELSISVTVASNNATTSGSGANTVCDPNTGGVPFCATVKLTSGAVPR